MSERASFASLPLEAVRRIVVFLEDEEKSVEKAQREKYRVWFRERWIDKLFRVNRRLREACMPVL
jgi:hypothetical protein